MFRQFAEIYHFFYFKCLALVRLPQKLKFSKYIQAVNLPKTCESPVGRDVIAIGHGLTRDGGSVSKSLKYAQIQTIPMGICNRIFGGCTDCHNHPDKFICAQDVDSNFKSTCSCVFLKFIIIFST